MDQSPDQSSEQARREERRNRPFSDQPSAKIRHSETSLGDPATGQSTTPREPDLSSIAMTEQSAQEEAERKEIRALGMTVRRHEDKWTRTPNTPGTGAIHVRTFHCKVTDDGLLYMDQLINEWLDAHPQYEVKYIQTSIGTFTGKIKEPHVICQVWV